MAEITPVANPINNPELVKAMNTVKEAFSQENNNRFLNELMKASFLVPAIIDPVPTPDANGKAVLTQDTKITFNLLSNEKGEKYFPAFTDWQELHRWQKDYKSNTVVLTFDEFATMILKDGCDAIGFVINAFNQNISFPKDQVASLAEQKKLHDTHGISRQEIKSDSKIEIGKPKEEPKELLDGISEYFAKTPEVNAGYMMFMRKDEKISILIIVDFNGNEDEIFGKIGEAAKPYLKDIPLAMVSVETPLGKNASQQTTPFYTK